MGPTEARVNQHYASYAICARLRRACSHHPRNAYIVYATNHTTSKHDHTHANEQSVSLSWQKLANGRRVSQSSPSSVFLACENPRVRTTARPIYCSERTALRARATPSVAVAWPENTWNALLRDKNQLDVISYLHVTHRSRFTAAGRSSTHAKRRTFVLGVYVPSTIHR